MERHPVLTVATFTRDDTIGILTDVIYLMAVEVAASLDPRRVRDAVPGLCAHGRGRGPEGIRIVGVVVSHHPPVRRGCRHLDGPLRKIGGWLLGIQQTDGPSL